MASTNFTSGTVIESEWLNDVNAVVYEDTVPPATQAAIDAVEDSLGTIASQDANAVAITGGTIVNITDLSIGDGGTGASDAATAFTNLKQAATTTSTGVVLLATDADIISGTATDRVITPGNFRNAALVTSTVVTLSGTFVDFTSIPSWVKRISVLFKDVSTNGTSPYIVQIGTSSGVATSGYSTAIVMIQNATTPATETSWTGGFPLCPAVSATASFTGRLILELQDSVTGTWVGTVTGSFATGTSTFGASSKTLSGTLDRLRITTAGGVNTFDAGTVNIIYE